MDTDSSPSPIQSVQPNVQETFEQLRSCLVQIGGLTNSALELLAALEPDIQRNAHVAGELHGLLKRLESESSATSSS